MNKRTIYAIIVGIVLVAVSIVLRVSANNEGGQLIVFFLTFFVVGLIAAGAKRGLSSSAFSLR